MSMGLVGRVVGTKMQKTAKVEVFRLSLDTYVLKYYKIRKKFFAHDEKERCRDGDLVYIESCPPISKHKHFNVVRIVERAPQLTDNIASKDTSLKHKDDTPKQPS
ncbi:small ribosomal subunit protein uS17m-like [Dysidea avara]|uniref:small ribosomal subunit protein uS17m-like n=1 Tax=Dysidea avara TaxID=196820 RepID=UPI00331D73E0